MNLCACEDQAVLRPGEPGQPLANRAVPRKPQPARPDLAPQHVMPPRNAPALLELVLPRARPPELALRVRAAQHAARRAVCAPGVRQSPVEASRVPEPHQLARPRPRDAL